MYQKILKSHLQLIGETKEPLPQSKTKDNVDLVGLSEPLEVLKDLMPLPLET